jgi:hypothetical protein
MIDMQSPRRGDAQFSGDFMNEHSHSSVQFSADKLRYLLVRMAVDCKLPFQFIESVSFRSVVDYLRSCTPGKAVLPSSDTFRRQMLDMYEEKSHQIKAILRGQRWISYTADLWTSPWKVPYFAITAHWINDEWKKKEVIIAFNRVEDKHTGTFTGIELQRITLLTKLKRRKHC